MNHLIRNVLTVVGVLNDGFLRNAFNLNLIMNQRISIALVAMVLTPPDISCTIIIYDR